MKQSKEIVNSMRLDYIDAFIIYTLYNSKYCLTASQLTEFISNLINSKNKKVLKQFIVGRLKKLNKYNIISINKVNNSIKCYNVNKKRVVSGNSKLVINDGNNDHSFDFDTLIGIKTDGTWIFIKI